MVRDKGEKKALLVSATGTGKTYLACFDVAIVKPKRVLFLAHREQILNQTIDSFKNVLGHHIEIGKVGGGKKEFDKNFVFSTVQTLSKPDVIENIPEDFYDYIVVDESHRSGADSYQRIINHFEPEFLLGMTATPERTDDYNICKDFDYNIAYEIRLEQAMKENMLCPFHYFGITELSVDGLEIEDESEFKYLVSDERVRHIIEKIKLYGYHGDVVKGLVFCSKNEEAKELSEAFNRRGFKTVSLSGSNTQEERENAIRRLEDESSYNHIDYIFTVDIFNEGVDIPEVNQVVMLRPTQSTIVFIQQLGRGLRKLKDKDFVVILDFIGNYKNNFMIPVELSEDKSFNKDNIRRFVAEGNRVFPGCSTINFDKIAKQKIYESIDSVNFSSVAFIRESYKNLKYRLGRIPNLMDFEIHGSMDIARIFENKSLMSHHIALKWGFLTTKIKVSSGSRKVLPFSFIDFSMEVYLYF